MKYDRTPALVQARIDPLCPRFSVRKAIEEEVEREDLVHWGRAPHLMQTVPDYFVDPLPRTKLFRFIIESMVL